MATNSFIDPSVIRYTNIREIKRDPILGIVTIMDGFPPMKGRYGNQLIAAHVNGAKSLIAYTIFLIRSPLLIALFFPFFRFKLLIKISDIFHKNLHPVWLPDDGLSRSGEELCRVFSFPKDCFCLCHSEIQLIPHVLISDSKIVITEKSINFPRVHCSNGCVVDQKNYILNVFKRAFLTFYEFDDAYRYRICDLLTEMNKELLKKNPREEIRRLCDLAIQREGYKELNNKYRMVKSVIRFLPRKYLRVLVDGLLSLDISKIKLDSDDMAFAKYKQYDFGGVIYKDKNVKYWQRSENKL